ncbi:endonuclease domain-containing 1 protein-like [Protopterus annectens]|uniref:endonuclease domain-containing 1 protein-like n=1 Tax=Protopterus annectens TaxID=7888 RepID=UPI001CF959AF|nr:endonuclease domain-containing 1 protein-like [Protopterus annectens]
MLTFIIIPILGFVTLWQVHADVLITATFQNSACSKFFYQNKEPAGFTNNNYARICQSWQNKYYFASLFDQGRRMPLYSASIYKYSDPGDNDNTDSLNDNWKYEPQLAYPNEGGEMKAITSAVKNDPIILNSQSVEINYSYTYHGIYYSRGHLNPASYQGSKKCKSATYTLTNAPPQPRDFNSQQWAATERKIAERLYQGCYVISGAIPYEADKWIPDNNNQRVAVPQFVWIAYCCPNHQNERTVAFLGHNGGSSSVTIGDGDNKLQFAPSEVKEIAVNQLESILKSRFNSNVSFQLFANDCS